MAQRPARPTSETSFPNIAFVNKANEPLGVDLQALINALDKQLKDDFYPVWGYPANLRATSTPRPDEWQIVFLDDADAANALGYHDITADGQPVSKVFVKTTLRAGQKVSVTASHELLEMLIDPGAQLWAQADNGVFYAYEMCDAVEEEEYSIDGVFVSDFVFPSFFESWHEPNSTPFDHLKKVSRPFQTLKKGYQIVSNGGTVKEIFGSAAKERHFRTVEDRKYHRSEYRILRAYDAALARGPGPTGAGSGYRAAMLAYAGRYLSALAGMVDPASDHCPSSVKQGRSRMVDPFPGDPWELSMLRRSNIVDPFPSDPFELAARRREAKRREGIVDPFPDDPFDI